MKFKAIVHEAEEGGFWAEVLAIPGCATQGETLDELLANLHEAIEGCLSVDLPSSLTSEPLAMNRNAVAAYEHGFNGQSGHTAS